MVYIQTSQSIGTMRKRIGILFFAHYQLLVNPSVQSTLGFSLKQLMDSYKV